MGAAPAARCCRVRSTLCTMVFLSCTAAPASGAETFPLKPIRIVTAEPGGGADFAARLIAHGLSINLGQPVIVENRGAGNGVLAAQTVARATPDGYTLLLYSSSLWTLPLMQAVPYDPTRDFAALTLAVQSPNILVVHPAVAAKTVGELIALAKAHPGKLNYGAGTAGSSSHLGPELFKAMTGTDIVRVSYKGGGPALTGLVAGEVQLVIASAGSAAMTHVKAGRLRALATTGSQASRLLPGLPPVAATVPGFDVQTTTGVFAPSRISAPLIARLNREFARVLEHNDTQEKFLQTGVEVVASPPSVLAAKVKDDMVRLGKVIRNTGIKSDG